MGSQLSRESKGLGLDLTVLNKAAPRASQGFVGDYAAGRITSDAINRLGPKDKVEFALVVAEELIQLVSQPGASEAAVRQASTYFVAYAESVAATNVHAEAARKLREKLDAR
jgi:hypothetical protein